ncbi:MAG: hypothetical protein J5644_04510 [Bacteroidales bacterium]|nr:hypothetical protein [Bacteroidales bacterium]
MKKVLCILAAVAMVAVFSTSCNKKCTCQVGGVTFKYDLKYLQDTYGVDIKKCSDLGDDDIMVCK